MDNIDFSIIVPVYNVEAYLDRCVRSVLNQSFSIFEIILIDDGSTDASGSLCDAWAERDCRVRVIHQKNGGASAARNAGIRAAKGEYILFLDSDDAWVDTSLLVMVLQRMRLSGADVLSFDYCKVYDGRRSGPYFGRKEPLKLHISGGAALETMTQEGLWIACAWNKVIRRRLILESDLFFVEGITAEDIDWCTRLALAADRVDYLNVVGVGYLQRKTSVSGSVLPEKVACLADSIVRSIKLLEAYESAKAAALTPYIGFQVATLVYTTALLENKTDRSAMVQMMKPLLPWLAHSQNRKVRIVCTVLKLCGLEGTLHLLRLRSFLTKK